jgi:glycosyltransferase involved in cell wall biosynthesis
MDNNICDSIKTLSILKFIIKSINPDILDIKLIFVGPQTDKTKDIAKRFNAKNFDFTWDNDFSSARNEALKHCSGEWILYLDADERLSNVCLKIDYYDYGSPNM